MILEQQLVESTVRPIARPATSPCQYDGREDEKKVPATPPRGKGRGILRANRTPPPPMIPSPTTLQKTTSEPTYRSIFEEFWDRRAAARPSSPENKGRHLRSPSYSVTKSPAPRPLRRTASDWIPRKDVEFAWQISPPPAKRVISGEHFRPIQEVPATLAERLPPVPLPLQRFFQDDGKLSCLGGAYPLVAPTRSILRTSSYARDDIEQQSNSRWLESVPAEFGDTFNLTRSFHPVNTLHLQDEASSNSGVSSQDRRVEFDPRVTVIEFPDDEVGRQWFSDADLDRCKGETISLAQQYLLKHPELLEQYNKKTLDPVTGTMRKKALFSLKVFSMSADDSEGMADENNGRDSKYRLAMREVKQIVIVDRNKLILDLFRRSLQTLFPNARISVYQSGEEALQCYERASSGNASQHGNVRGIDIVIAEERLHQPLVRLGTPEGKASSLPKNLLSSRRNKGYATWVSWKSLSSLPNKDESEPRMSGSELFSKILMADECGQNDASTAVPAEASALTPIQWPPLLIGVSMRPQIDASTFYDHGADLVWGKPPPNMNECLRDQLVAALLKKRRRRSVCSDSNRDSRED